MREEVYAKLWCQHALGGDSGAMGVSEQHYAVKGLT
jgi:hypothetical protein